MSDQVREPATPCIAVAVHVKIEGLEGSPTHTPAAEGELQLVSGGHYEELIDTFKEDLIDWFGEVITSSPVSPESPLVLSCSHVSPESPLDRSSSPMSPVSPLVPSSSPMSPVSPLVPSSSPDTTLQL